MTSRKSIQGNAIDRILVINPGYGYTLPPTVTISGGSGSGGIATALIATGSLGLVGITSGGVGYSTVPTITFGSGNAVAKAFLNSNGSVSAVRFKTAGYGYTSGSVPSISFSDPTSTPYGDFDYNEVVTGTKSGTTGYVKSWDAANRILKVAIVDGNFALGEGVVGAAASYRISSIKSNEFLDSYAENVQIEQEADMIVDFTQKNPFGEY